ncbi:sterol desaturase family protein [Aliamphritea ceti]|uniref:sterol desaturase family protein n=1 Tax=Aliamphritea ceti TaxID=1524258 RepID=UPI0021C4BF18|nr:sterol desaturase family protein [Aliamphritea ceti]
MQTWFEMVDWQGIEPWIRIASFFAVFVVMASWENIYPARVSAVNRGYRWLHNLALVSFNIVLVRFALPVAPVAVAVYCDQHQLGVFNMLDLPLVAGILLSLVVLDLVLYLQHRAFHRIPWLWRLHRMHHSDQDVDVTTGLRFHPFEIALSLLIKMLVVLLLGAPVQSVIIFEVILSSMAVFNHANISLPQKMELWLRRVLVTPDMHRIHHSVDLRETHTNFGFNLSCWDYLFGSYCSFARTPLQVGVRGLLQHSEQRIDKLLTQPFRQAGPIIDE